MSHPFHPRKSQAYKARQLAELRASKQATAGRLTHMQGMLKASGSVASAVKALNAAIKNFKQIEKQIDAELAALSKLRIVKTESYRAFQIENGITRGAQLPNRMTTLFTVEGAILAEGGLTGVLMIADGKMDVITGLAYGVSIAAINIAAGLFAGYFPGRYLDYRIDAVDPKPIYRFKRRVAWAGFTTLLGGMAVLNFAAARLRATGSPEGIFTFDDVGFSATFNDYYAIAILTLGALGGLLAIYKGRTGIDDPIPGYAELRRECEQDILDAAESIYERYLETTGTAFERAEDSFEERIEDIEEAAQGQDEEYAALSDDIVAHNHKVDSAIEQLERLREEDRATSQFIKQRKQPAEEIDTIAFDALRLASIDTPNTGDPADETIDTGAALQRLETAYERSCAVIHRAYTTFLSGVSAFALNNDEEGD